jgi:hypothetical protein
MGFHRKTLAIERVLAWVMEMELQQIEATAIKHHESS